MNIFERMPEILFSTFGVMALLSVYKSRARMRDEQGEQKYHDLMNTLDGIVWEAEVDRPGYTFVSDQAYRILGYSPEQWIQTPRFWQKLIVPEDREKLEEAGFLGAQNKTDRQIEYRVQTADGRILWMKDYIKVIHQGEDQPKKLRGIMVDISDRKKVEANLELAQKQAVQALNAKSEFLANISHEIRTPLNAIIGMSEIAIDSKDRKESIDCLRTIKISADYLLSLINDVLDLSKIEAGRLELEKSEFNLYLLCKNAIDLISVMATSKGLAIKMDYQVTEFKYVTGDSGRILQVLLNLLSNAVKFTLQGQVTLQVKANLTSKYSAKMEFSVIDTGIGMNSSEIGRLFQPFTQADSSTARKFGGSGLGLNIAKRLVEMMGGQISVQSEKNKGSIFTFNIPLQINADSEAENLSHSEDPASQFDARVLVVDDNQTNQKVMARYLTKLGCRTEIAADGLEAISAFQRGRFQLVLMDCQMPEMDGYEATRIIRKYEKEHNLRRTPILALTAHALSGDRDKCFAADMDEYLTKPISFSKLNEILRRYLDMKNSGASPEYFNFGEIERIDTKHLADLIEVDEGRMELLHEVFGIFEDQCIKKLQSMSLALDKSDLQLFGSEIHTFKTTCYNAGAKRASAICKELQLLIESGKPEIEVICHLKVQLEDEIEAVLEELKTYIDKVAGDLCA